METPNPATVCALALEGAGIVNPMAADGFAARGLLFRPFEPGIAGFRTAA